MRRFEVRTNLSNSDPFLGSAMDICAAINHLARLLQYDDDMERLRAVLDEIVDPDNQCMLGFALVAVERAPTP